MIVAPRGSLQAKISPPGGGQNRFYSHLFIGTRLEYRRDVLAGAKLEPSDYEELPDQLMDVHLPAPPQDGAIQVRLMTSDIQRLDLGPFYAALQEYLLADGGHRRLELLQHPVSFQIEYTAGGAEDPRELCEIPEVRLWFLRLDSECPWLPCVLDWRAGELARYAAMCVPHQVSRKDGIVYNPEALELFMTGKMFACYAWLEAAGLADPMPRIRDMYQVVGFRISTSIFDVIRATPSPAKALAE
eukprot:jgi/Mesvir1/26088/Mv06808-RA.1